jgi:hypothetical protein
VKGRRQTLPGLLIFLSILLSGCERGCARDWLVSQGVGGSEPMSSGSLPMNAVDCPDGLARCTEGNVFVSRLAMIPQPCRRPPPQCDCPWERVAACDTTCAAEGAEVAVESALAARQLCLPASDAAIVMHSTGALPAPPGCSDGQLYRCVDSDVIACHENAVIGRCSLGCFAPGASVDDGEPVNREAAFAILCSR